MKMLMHAKLPNEPFNTLVKSGTVGQKIQAALADIKPEAVYFTEFDGKRSAMMIVNLQSPSEVPHFAEPFFLMFNADVTFHVVMSPEDLDKAGLDAIGTKWS